MSKPRHPRVCPGHRVAGTFEMVLKYGTVIYVTWSFLFPTPVLPKGPKEKTSTTYPKRTFTTDSHPGPNKRLCVDTIKNTNLKTSRHHVETTTVTCPTQNVTTSSENPGPHPRATFNITRRTNIPHKKWSHDVSPWNGSGLSDYWPQSGG